MEKKQNQTLLQIKIYNKLKQVPKGKVITYKELAKKINKPRAVRVVANAVGANPIPVIIPCHRVYSSRWFFGWIFRQRWY